MPLFIFLSLLILRGLNNNQENLVMTTSSLVNTERFKTFLTDLSMGTSYGAKVGDRYIVEGGDDVAKLICITLLGLNLSLDKKCIINNQNKSLDEFKGHCSPFMSTDKLDNKFTFPDKNTLHDILLNKEDFSCIVNLADADLENTLMITGSFDQSSIITIVEIPSIFSRNQLTIKKFDRSKDDVEVFISIDDYHD